MERFKKKHDCNNYESYAINEMIQLKSRSSNLSLRNLSKVHEIIDNILFV
jgi:hypothetical protein